MALKNPFKTQDSTAPDPNDSKSRIKRLQNEVDVAVKWFEKNFWPYADERVNFYELNHYYDPFAKTTPMVDFDRIKVPYPYRNSRQILAEIYMKLPEPIVRPTKADKAQIQQVEDQDPLLGQSFQPTLTVIPPMDESGVMTGQPQKVDLHKGAAKLKASIVYCRDKSRLKNEGKLFALDGIVTGMGVMMFSSQKNSKVPKYTRCLYRHILFSPDAINSPYDSPWVARKITRRLDEAQKDESYIKEAREALKACAQPDKDLIENLKDYGQQFAYTVIWDYQNKQTNEHLVWGEGGSEFLSTARLTDELNIKLDTDEYTVDYPYIFFIDEELLSKALGMGDIAPILPQVKENDKVRTMQVNHLKRFHRKYGYTDDILDEQGREQLKQPYDGMMVKFKDPAWQQSFGPIQDAPISRDMYQVGELIERDVQTISPIGPNALVSGTGQQPDTLGQSQLINENTQTRLDEKRDNLANCYSRLFRMTGQYIQQYWVEEDVIRITGDGSKPTDWLFYSPQEVQGEYDYETDIESMRDNTVLYRRQLAEAMQVSIPILAQINPSGVPVLLRQYYETFPNLRTFLDQLVPEQLTAPQQETPDQMMAKDELINLIKTQGPQAVLDKVRTLPENERQAIESQVNRIIAELSNGQNNLGQPNQSAMMGAINKT